MPDVSAFRGTLFDPDRVAVSSVLAPPYDVIDDAWHKQLKEKHKNNCVRLVSPEGEGALKYENARKSLANWVKSGILRRDERPALYRYHQTFSLRGLPSTKVVRKGFIGAVRLHEFSDNVIRRHEETLQNPKVDRLNLMRATRSHLSQIFTMYSDTEGVVDAAFASVVDGEPALRGTTDDQTVHELWRLENVVEIAKIQRFFKSRHLYIADGHHRYETMLALRRELDPSFRSRDLAFGTMFLSNMDDPGLVVFPTHRMVHSVGNFSKDALIEKLKPYFEVQTTRENSINPIEMAAFVTERLQTLGASAVTFAMVFADEPVPLFLSLRKDANLQKFDFNTESPASRLDVTILHRVILDQLIGIDQAAKEQEKNIHYIKDIDDALVRMRKREGQVCFFMNATSLQQVKDVSDAKEVMPPKSTYFFPKIASGLVIRELDVPIGAT